MRARHAPWHHADCVPGLHDRDDLGDGHFPEPAPLALPTLQPVAFLNAWEEHQGAVRRTLRRLGVVSADLDDLTQEVFFVFFCRRDDYDPTRAVLHWLRGIARRVAAAHRRRARHEAEVLCDHDAVTGSVDAAPAQDRVLELREECALAIAALCALDLDRRELLIMHHLEGVAMPEISRVLGVPLNTAYSRLRLARDGFDTEVHRLRRGAGVNRRRSILVTDPVSRSNASTDWLARGARGGQSGLVEHDVERS
jgi:RNA polymerase sigma-70 factor (ECF subfamily)